MCMCLSRFLKTVVISNSSRLKFGQDLKSNVVLAWKVSKTCKAMVREREFVVTCARPRAEAERPAGRFAFLLSLLFRLPETVHKA